MEPSASGAASASFTRRCWSMSGSPSKASLTTVTWKWSPPPVLSSTSTARARKRSLEQLANGRCVHAAIVVTAGTLKPVRLFRSLIVFKLGFWAGLLGSAALVKRVLPSRGDADSDELGLVAIFDGIELESHATAFQGGTMFTWFGGIAVDLRGDSGTGCPTHAEHALGRDRDPGAPRVARRVDGEGDRRRRRGQATAVRGARSSAAPDRRLRAARRDRGGLESTDAEPATD